MGGSKCCPLASIHCYDGVSGQDQVHTMSLHSYGGDSQRESRRTQWQKDPAHTTAHAGLAATPISHLQQRWDRHLLPLDMSCPGRAIEVSPEAMQKPLFPTGPLLGSQQAANQIAADTSPPRSSQILQSPSRTSQFSQVHQAHTFISNFPRVSGLTAMKTHIRVRPTQGRRCSSPRPPHCFPTSPEG